jgi:hypothetical protein
LRWFLPPIIAVQLIVQPIFKQLKGKKAIDVKQKGFFLIPLVLILPNF